MSNPDTTPVTPVTPTDRRDRRIITISKSIGMYPFYNAPEKANKLIRHVEDTFLNYRSILVEDRLLTDLEFPKGIIQKERINALGRKKISSQVKRHIDAKIKHWTKAAETARWIQQSGEATTLFFDGEIAHPEDWYLDQLSAIVTSPAMYNCFWDEIQQMCTRLGLEIVEGLDRSSAECRQANNLVAAQVTELTKHPNSVFDAVVPSDLPPSPGYAAYHWVHYVRPGNPTHGLYVLIRAKLSEPITMEAVLPNDTLLVIQGPNPYVEVVRQIETAYALALHHGSIPGRPIDGSFDPIRSLRS